MLSPAQRKRYARQLLLSEIGERGQVALCAARVRIDAAADARAAAVARTYLERAGLTLDDAADDAVTVLDAGAVDALAGDARLREAAAALVGSFAAVEAIKAALGVGTPSAIPSELSLVEKKWSAP